MLFFRNYLLSNELKSSQTKVIASTPIFLYHLKTMKQELWTTLVMYLAFCIDKQRQEGRMRCEMSKFTVLGKFN